MPSPIILVTKTGTICSESREDIERMRQEFCQKHCIRLPKFLEPSLLQIVQRQIEKAQFYERMHRDLGSEGCMYDNTTPVLLLHLLVNNKTLFQAIEQITGCDPIGCFRGRLYRVIPGHSHHDSWHSDMTDHRMIAMSINLSTEVYYGGVLQIRDEELGQIVYEATNTGFGDAIIFRLASRLKHRLTGLEGTASKTAFAGWFRSQPDYKTFLKKRLSRAFGN